MRPLLFSSGFYCGRGECAVFHTRREERRLIATQIHFEMEETIRQNPAGVAIAGVFGASIIEMVHFLTGNSAEKSRLHFLDVQPNSTIAVPSIVVYLVLMLSSAAVFVVLFKDRVGVWWNSAWKGYERGEEERMAREVEERRRLEERRRNSLENGLELRNVPILGEGVTVTAARSRIRKRRKSSTRRK